MSLDRPLPPRRTAGERSGLEPTVLADGDLHIRLPALLDEELLGELQRVCAEAASGDRVRSITVDAAACEDLPSLAYSALCYAARKASERGVAVRLVNLDSRLRRIVMRLGIDCLIEVEAPPRPTGTDG